MYQTPEDQAINRRVAERLGTWAFLDAEQPSAVWQRHSMARGRTVAMTGIQPQISCTGWDEPIK